MEPEPEPERQEPKHFALAEPEPEPEPECITVSVPNPVPEPDPKYNGPKSQNIKNERSTFWKIILILTLKGKILYKTVLNIVRIRNRSRNRN